jgi:hypothetical protein
MTGNVHELVSFCKVNACICHTLQLEAIAEAHLHQPASLATHFHQPLPVAGLEAANELFNDIQNLIIRALLAVQPAMINDKHCFEVSQTAAITCLESARVPNQDR